jgi:BirA family biotin operon repressor/biotin-[acetyl-CoA-carboxylase] ligase
MSDNVRIAHSADSLPTLLHKLDPLARFEHVPTIGSTNTELMRRARAGDTSTCLLWADQQSAGRGRMGRQWQGQAGDALTFSLGTLLSPADWSGLSLAVGCCLADSLDPSHALGIGLKWPNDLVVKPSPNNMRKLGGILIETVVRQEPGHSSRFAVIGIGLNLSLPVAADYRNEPAGLREWLGQGLQPHEVLHTLLQDLMEGLQRFERAGFAAFHTAFMRRDALAGQMLTLSNGKQGRAAGVDSQGVLQIDSNQGRIQVSSDEVSVSGTAS